MFDVILFIYFCFGFDGTSGDEDAATSGSIYHSDCIGLSDGSYTFQFSSDGPLVNLDCSNEYVILNVNKDDKIKEYFTSFEKWHYAIGGPKKSDPVNWNQWFKPNNNDNDGKFLISPQCDVCDKNNEIQVYDEKSSYWMTANMLKLHWAGGGGAIECIMDPDTYECYDCSACDIDDNDNYSQRNTGGICTPSVISKTASDYSVAEICGVAVESSDTQVETIAQNALITTSYQYRPSIGTDGRFCVCYQPLTKSDNIKYNTNHYKKQNSKNYDYDEEMSTDRDITSNDVDKSISVTRVDGHWLVDDGGNRLISEDLRETNIVYLSQKDFLDGTYRIKKSGTYILLEDIEFNFNSENDYWPYKYQNEEYPGAGGYRDEYNMGFFAGITIECDNVVIDLNEFEMKQSVKFYFQQRFFTIIELSNQIFKPNVGPATFGASMIGVSNVDIKNGVLGLSSHMGIHGNYVTNLKVENVHIKDFVTHGVLLNGWENVEMNNIEVGPSSTIDYLKGDYGHGRILLYRLKDLENDLINDGSISNIDKRILFDNRDDGDSVTLSDIIDELELEMEYALNYAMNRVNNKLSENDFLESISADKEIWLKSKQLFVNTNGLPSTALVHGIFLNLFSGKSAYIKQTQIFSKNAVLNNIYIHDLKHCMIESIRVITDDNSLQWITPMFTQIPGESLFGSMDNLMQFVNTVNNSTKNNNNNNNNSTNDMFSQFKYVGSAMTDGYIALGHLTDNWDYLGGTTLQSAKTTDKDWRNDMNNLYLWATGEHSASSQWKFGCNQDIMFHSGKGIVGLRIEATDTAILNDIRITNLHQVTPLGSNVCTKFFNSDGTGYSGQTYPMQRGFSGNNLQGISICSSVNVYIDGSVYLSNFVNDYSETSGISVWTGNDVTISSTSNILISNIYSGIKLYDDDDDNDNDVKLLTYNDLPNRSPESCGFRIETDVDTNILYDSTITFLNENDNANNGEYNVIVCNVNGFEMCLGDNDYYGETMYGKYYTKCSDSDSSSGSSGSSSLLGWSNTSGYIIINDTERMILLIIVLMIVVACLFGVPLTKFLNNKKNKNDEQIWPYESIPTC